MIFSGIPYIIFFSLMLFLMAVIPRNEIRKYLLLAGSYFFYAWWDYRFLALIFTLSAANYFFGNRIAAAPESPAARRWVITAVVFDLCILGFFKYFNFFIGSANVALAAGHARLPFLNIILPVGISFITFEVMSYTIDIRRGVASPAPRFLDLALLVAFFPHLIAGPILKPRQFLPQLEKDIIIRWDNIERGAQMFLIGLVKKIIVADNLAFFVNPVFADPALYHSATVWMAVIAYSLQIYCDFSAYSDMAIGSARCLGFDIPKNFNFPYISRNIAVFWRRWHISLSTWLRDYLYISLGGNRRGRARQYANLMITMLLGGLWHGASWNFVVWGGLHGAALAVHRMYGDILRGRRLLPGPAAAVFGGAFTYLFVCLAWVFFRSKKFSVSLLIFQKLFFIGDTGGVRWFSTMLLIALPLVMLNHFIGEKYGEYPALKLTSFTGLFVVIFILMGLLFLAPLQSTPFIYFAF